ncbi:kinase-like domain-containing protein [Astrocystis sublimbata]|nr:kinase-like domain-containing protein [Astrocystis sublimbata]
MFQYSSHQDVFRSRVRSSRLPWDASTTAASRHVPRSSRMLLSAEYPDETTTLEAVIDTLELAGLPGPAVMIGRNEYLGQGSQSVVFKQTIVWSGDDDGQLYHDLVAVKQPKFEHNPYIPLRLEGPKAMKRLNDVCLEVKALSLPRLRNHPNIVRLLSWSFDASSFNNPIWLVMELASSNLEAFLSSCSKELDEIGFQQRYQLCLGMASGLDAIHSCMLIHGDLKPSNVLLVEDGDRLVPKLADFGLSISWQNGKDAAVRLGGTEGWQAPEVAAGRPVLSSQLHKTDNYSFGLVASHTLFSERNCAEPPFKPVVADIKSEAIAGVDMEHVQVAIRSLLNLDPAQRPDDLEPLFESSVDRECPTSHHHRLAFEVEPAPNGSQHEPEEQHDASAILAPTLPWEGPGLPGYLLSSLLNKAISDPELFSSSILFRMFLALTLDSPLNPSSLDILIVAAFRGSSRAQAAVSAVSEHYQDGVPDKIREHASDWLRNAVENGCTLAKRRLLMADTASYKTALDAFRSNGGYGEFYWTQKGLPNLHRLVLYATLREVKDYMLSSEPWDLEGLTNDGETPLYLACARGAWDIAQELLDKGASASASFTVFGISCLHWVFAFDEPVQALAITRLIAAGADINARAR